MDEVRNVHLGERGLFVYVISGQALTRYLSDIRLFHLCGGGEVVETIELCLICASVADLRPSNWGALIGSVPAIRARL